MLALRLRSFFLGELVAKDSFGNRYYRRKNYSGPWQKEPRWVLYKGIAEGSKVPALWHSWLHHTTQFPLTVKKKYASWEKPHRPNLTGTAGAFKPENSPSLTGSSADFEAWPPPKPYQGHPHEHDT